MKALNAREYRETYYADEFVYGMGTEDVLALLHAELPPVASWIDLGSGSESLLWGTAIDARQLIAVDRDAERLRALRDAARTSEPTGAYRTALTLSGQPVGAWRTLCARLTATRLADCLSGATPALAERAELVTQFGLLGLCRDNDHFKRCFVALAALAHADGWLAGANWVAADLTGRVHLATNDYAEAIAAAGAEPVEIRRLPSSDPDYPAVWTYVAKLSARGT